VCGGRVGEREDLLDLNPDRSAPDQYGDLGELSA
jgi:hypothetical protein